MLADLRTRNGVYIAKTYSISESAVSAKKRELGLPPRVVNTSQSSTKYYSGKLQVLNRIITEIRERHLNYDQLQKMTGVSRGALQDLLGGNGDPQMSTVIACVEALGIVIKIPDI